jgi:hypothetical protein
VGERNDAYSSSAVSCCCSVWYSAWYFEIVCVFAVDAGVTDGACPVVKSDFPTDDNRDVADAAVLDPDEPDEDVLSDEPSGEMPLMSPIITVAGQGNL